jgi:hypothetical protein
MISVRQSNEIWMWKLWQFFFLLASWNIFYMVLEEERQILFLPDSRTEENGQWNYFFLYSLVNYLKYQKLLFVFENVHLCSSAMLRYWAPAA